MQAHHSHRTLPAIRLAHALPPFAVCVAWFCLAASLSAGEALQFKHHTVTDTIKFGYQLVAADLTGDGNKDLIAIDERADELAWFENPTWTRHVLAKDVPRPLNAACHDIDGDGIPEVVLAYRFESRPEDSVGIVALLKSGPDVRQPWTATEIDRVPTAHRVRWIDPAGDGNKVLLLGPMVGERFPPQQGDHVPIHLYRPDDWKRETITRSPGGVLHAIVPVTWDDGPGQQLLTASFLGLHRFEFVDGEWEVTQITAGDPRPWPECGSSEVRLGHLGESRFLAAIEPWHGNQVVVYLPGGKAWKRTVIEDKMQNGHALAVGDLDGDGRDEIVCGFRGKGHQLSIYQAGDSAGKKWNKTVLDDGGMAGADCLIEDFTGDGRPDVVCIGASTGNVKLYENLGVDSNVRHMWDCGMPKPEVPGAGYPILENAEHFQLYKATRETGGYSHHSQLLHHGGRFYAMWSNHRFGEDGPGQRVLWASSDDGANWSDWAELFPSPMPMRPSEEPGFVLTAGGWTVVGDRLFALASGTNVTGFENSERTSVQPRPDREHRFRKREYRGRFAREVLADGSLGRIFCVEQTPPELDELAFQAAKSDDPQFAPLAAAIRRQFPQRKLPDGVDTNRLCEPTFYQARDGRHVVLMRDDCYSHRMYVSISEDGVHWPTAYPTDIPDSPSLTTNVVLEDGTVLLIGNQMAPQFDNPGKPDHYGRDPLMVSVSADGYLFTRAYALRCGQQEWRIPRTEVRGRGGGAQYPSALVHGGYLYVLYSMGKEDVWISRVPLVDLGL